MEMDNQSTITREEDQMDLPPGFRFHPTDEELITHYLSEKVLDRSFAPIAIGEADLNQIEPWELPRVAKMGEKEWYFFVVRDRKYPTGLRTNRATQMGYWKATGKDKEIFRGNSLVGMKKTLVFYMGRAPKGEKTNWVMHEFRLEGKFSRTNVSKNSKNDWVISRVFEKNSGAKRPNTAEFVRVEELHPPYLPPLMDSSPDDNNHDTRAVIANPDHVTCFSNTSSVIEGENDHDHVDANPEQEEFNMFGTSYTNTDLDNSLTAISNMLSEPDDMSSYQFMDSIFGQQDQSMLKLLLEGKGSSPNKADLSTVDVSHHDVVNNLSLPFDHDCLWNY